MYVYIWEITGPGPRAAASFACFAPPPPPSGFPGGLQGSKTAHDGFQTALEASRAL